MLAYVSLSKLWMNIFQAMTLFREANISFNHILTHSTIKYVKRRAPNRSSLNGRLRRKVPTVSGTNGHFHYCCAIFTNNKFHTLNMSLCVKGFDGAFAFFFACSCHSSFCAFSLPLSANLFMPAFGLKIYHFSFSMFVPNSFRAQNTFCFSFRAVVLRRWVFYVLSDRAQTRGNSRDSQSAFQSQPKTWATWSSGEGPGVVKRLQTTMARSECFVFCHIKKM